jgi:hypothetical protein
MENKNINELIKHIENEIELSESIILNTTWTAENIDILYKNIDIMNKYKQTLIHIKQYLRGLI